jgi:hypothetical protein
VDKAEQPGQELNDSPPDESTDNTQHYQRSTYVWKIHNSVLSKLTGTVIHVGHSWFNLH